LKGGEGDMGVRELVPAGFRAEPAGTSWGREASSRATRPFLWFCSTFHTTNTLIRKGKDDSGVWESVVSSLGGMRGKALRKTMSMPS